MDGSFLLKLILTIQSNTSGNLESWFILLTMFSKNLFICIINGDICVNMYMTETEFLKIFAETTLFWILQGVDE